MDPVADVRRPAPLLVLGALLAALCVAVLVSLNTGATGITLFALAQLAWDAWSGHAATPTTETAELVLMDIRLPRTVLGLLVGAALGGSGAVMQGLFRNPLADPGLIGVSAGAALATAVMIVLGDSVLSAVIAPLGLWALPLAGLAGGFAATVLLYVLATREGTTEIVTVLLGGVALSAFAGALTGILIFVADDRQLRDLTFWTLGSLAGASWPRIAALLPFIAAAAACMPMLANPLNALLLGEEEAFHMGAAVERAKRLSLFAVASAVGASVSAVGIIGFIGVLVPHLVRLRAGPDHRIVLPGSALLGALLLILSDTAARTLAAPADMPVGIVTAAIGAPCFFWLLLRLRGLTS